VIVSGDYDLLKQMVLNVGDNAIEFTSKDGHVDIMLGLEEGWTVIQGSDSGQGIPKEDLPRLSRSTKNAGASGRSLRRGVGLGLALIKQVIDLHNGQLEIQSQEGRGTMVKMHLPNLLTADQDEETP